MMGLFSQHWHGQVPLRVPLWRDMLCVGNLVNIACMSQTPD
jgi:hypothetical protein